MGRRKRSVLARTDNLKKTKDENPAKRQKHDHLLPRPGKENANVSLVHGNQFATRSHRFMDAYEQGLNGRQAAWAARKYRGHRVLPVSIMKDLEKAGIV